MKPDYWRMYVVMWKVQNIFVPYRRDDGTYAVHETRQAARQELWALRGIYKAYGKKDIYVQKVGAIS